MNNSTPEFMFPKRTKTMCRKKPWIHSKKERVKMNYSVTEHLTSFYWCLCNIAGEVSSNLWIRVHNSNDTDVWSDPWLFNIPIAFKPTFINVDLLPWTLTIVDFMNFDKINLHACKIPFGDGLWFDLDVMAKWTLDSNGINS